MLKEEDLKSIEETLYIFSIRVENFWKTVLRNLICERNLEARTFVLPLRRHPGI
jgi:hypothetical protein